jgi:membrane associated rhomboid family serine protease
VIFPIGDENIKGGYKPMITYLFLAINVLIFMFQITLDIEGTRMFLYEYGTIPTEILRGEDYFTLLTNMFLHGGWMHIIGNMLFLWVFADNIEAVIGNVNFLVFYLLGGLFASLLHIFLNPTSNIPAVGASGAISAVMGAYLIMFPKSQIKVLIIFLFRSIYMSALIFLGLWFVQNLISGLGALGPESAQASGTAWWAHIGGFLFGLLAGYFAKKSYLELDYGA